MTLALLSGPALAQAAATGPVQISQLILDEADPAQIRRRIEEQKKEPEPRAPELRLPKAPGPAPEPAEAPAFVLGAVVIDGATVFGPEDLIPLYQDFIAQQITLGEVDTILAAITELYQDAGYFLSRAVASPQDLAAGILMVRVIEGYIDAVDLRGVDRVPMSLAPYRDGFLAERPLTRASLERGILLINDLAGVGADASIRPLDEDAGRYELVLDLSFDEFDAFSFLDNRGTPAVGPLQGYFSTGVNSVFGSGERIQAGFFTVPNHLEELIYYSLSYDQPLGSDGTSVNLFGSHSTVDAGDSLALSDTESTADVISVALRHPVIRTRDETLWVNAIFDFQNFQEERFFGVKTIEDQLRVFRARANYTRSDDWAGTTSFEIEVSQGVDILGASSPGSPELSRTNGESEFTKVRSTLTWEQGIAGNFGIRLAVTGQNAFDTLLSAEEFTVGGSRFGRAYDFSELSGEDGLAAAVELRYGQALDGRWLQAFQFYGFYDIGHVWNDVTLGGQVEDSLSSVGGGVRLRLFPAIRAELEVAKPLTRDVSTEGDRDPRVFFSLSISF